MVDGSEQTCMQDKMSSVILKCSVSLETITVYIHVYITERVIIVFRVFHTSSNRSENNTDIWHSYGLMYL